MKPIVFRTLINGIDIRHWIRGIVNKEAVLRDPEIYIFDEATSSLDNLSERIVQDAILNLSKETTVIVIAHRLTTILSADEILFLNKGRIVESGMHEQLMRKKGEYYNLYRKEE